MVSNFLGSTCLFFKKIGGLNIREGKFWWGPQILGDQKIIIVKKKTWGGGQNFKEFTIFWVKTFGG